MNGHEGTLVDLTGIAHFVVEGVEPSEGFFRAAESIFSGIAGLDACGVIFLNAEKRSMTPLVKVIETDSLVWEGSCGSGSVACAVAQSERMENGGFSCEYRQPAGAVRASVERQGGNVIAASIGGEVTLAVHRDDSTPTDSIFIPFAYREAAANLLTNAALDPFGKIPEFKYCAVRIEAA